jgi:hypothetical protein
LQNFYDEKKFKLALTNSEIMLERYPLHPGKVLSKQNDVFRIKRDEGTDFVWHGPLSGCYRLDKENAF